MTEPTGGMRSLPLIERFRDGRPPRGLTRQTIIEAPIAIEINGIAYAVMMATPSDLEDYALGFCLSEQLIATPGEFLGCEAAKLDRGWIVRILLEGARAEPLMARARMRLTEGSCGLCGIESLDQVLRPLPAVTASLEVSDAALFDAASALRAHQPLGTATGAAHAAAFCSSDGSITLLREDVGRHNAFDKLIGAMARRRVEAGAGFVLLSARCSFELVQKAIVAGVPLLATVSAASTLALETAHAHALRLVSLLRSDSFLESGCPQEPTARSGAGPQPSIAKSAPLSESMLTGLERIGACGAARSGSIEL